LLSFDQSKVPASTMMPPIELPWPARKLRQRMHDDIGAMIDRADQIGRRQRVVDDQGHAGLARHG